MKKILLTGGGTAGHVTPNIALLPSLRKENFDILYIGSYDGIEKRLMQNENVAYKGISTGKLRRDKSFKSLIRNLEDPFRVLKGYNQAKKIIRDYQPDVVFSKGGFVSVPVVLAARKVNKKLPIIIHESDMTPGLANKICMKKATKVCCNFPETIQYLPEGKAVLSGSPIREELLSGSKEAGYAFTGLNADKPVLMMMGGSTGSRVINTNLRKILPKLLDQFQVVHLCGKGNYDESLAGLKGYVQYEYISAELKDLFAMADVILSRAGANAICELLALKKPNILVPLSAKVSRGDQILNADSYKKQGFSYVLEEESMNEDTLFEGIQYVYAHRDTYMEAMSKSELSKGIDVVMGLIRDLS